MTAADKTIKDIDGNSHQLTHSGISVAELGELRIQQFILEIAEWPFSIAEGLPPMADQASRNIRNVWPRS